MISISSDRKHAAEKCFSRYAHLYDKYADIQHYAARKLIGEELSGRVGNVLEIGCGTGNYTALLREKFISARIKALDISKDMIEVAKQKLAQTGIEFEIADAEAIIPGERFDLITSNAVFQWFDDPGKSIEKYVNVLAEEGVMLFSVFGPLTFRELNKSLKETFGPDARIVSDNFLGKEQLENMLKRYFKKSAVTEEIVTEKYQTLSELLKKIKYTGTRGSGTGSLLLWKRDALRKIEERYMLNFGCIKATYQIFYCRAVK